jgi:hypothetical protein
MGQNTSRDGIKKIAETLLDVSKHNQTKVTLGVGKETFELFIQY